MSSLSIKSTYISELQLQVQNAPIQQLNPAALFAESRYEVTQKSGPF